jgi:hypothetical protein
MSVIAEIEISCVFGDEPWRKEWLMVRRRDGYTSLGRDHVGYDGERRSWQDEGISIDDDYLDAVIEALQSVRSGLSGSVDR